MQTTNTQTKKITLSTVKSFLKKNAGNIWVDTRSSFDGMTDGVESLHGGFMKAIPTTELPDARQGIEGTWFVGSSRDYFQPYEDNEFTGIEVSNSCGCFVIAIKK